ncbi:hypothetical protein Poli38472_002805 [Pythium oligandrum]|uniref:B box-type domain-containing protein n=1 Tax=Pythium oligandrum TaxID=41045 RepID=A0A8K1CHU6_PYTOL|nr:hypothetical protein Poli38472_002805 [Pythium oligandrum]|eukprot:TMW63864.1 hypothetical protein Poli38472_002805 [Pythium oligandrum]
MDVATPMCVECEDTDAAVRCEDCQDLYCALCFEAQHRSGTRRQHATTELFASAVAQQLAQPPPAPVQATTVAASAVQPAQESTTVVEGADEPMEAVEDKETNGKVDTADEETDEDDEVDSDADSDDEPTMVSDDAPLLRDAMYIPLRLTEDERAQFNLLDASLNVSEYTDKVDVLSYRSPVKRVIQELKEVLSTVSGMMVATDFRKGKRLVLNNKFEDNDTFFREVFEIGRRYKIMNPERMRNNYGKMIYMLQDASMREIKNYLGFSCVGPIQTVKSFLKKRHALDLLKDRRCVTATAVFSSTSLEDDEAKPEDFLQEKQRAIDELVRDYASSSLSANDIRLVLASIDDSQSYLVSNRTPIIRMIKYLNKFFQPDRIEPNFSLEIRAGRNGARLSHSHASQYEYVLQSLLLWRNITTAMLRLWWAIEEDLLEGSAYRLRDTGQGLNRVQHAPKTSNLVHRILHQTQKLRPRWVGSSVVHLGDHNVPNALMFIDKYTQVSRILSPIVNTLDEIANLAEHPDTKAYIMDFGGREELQKQILCDFFKHGFDGSGADNFFDAGSCIDGRLTSAWNWCSKIEKKPFFHVFLMAGFVGFDGQFESCQSIMSNTESVLHVVLIPGSTQPRRARNDSKRHKSPKLKPLQPRQPNNHTTNEDAESTMKHIETEAARLKRLMEAALSAKQVKKAEEIMDQLLLVLEHYHGILSMQQPQLRTQIVTYLEECDIRLNGMIAEASKCRRQCRFQGNALMTQVMERLADAIDPAKQEQVTMLLDQAEDAYRQAGDKR